MSNMSPRPKTLNASRRHQLTRITRSTRHIWQNASDRIFRSGELARAGKTPFQTIYGNKLVTLRYYAPVEGSTTVQHRTPLVIVPPLAVNMLIYDLFPERSLVNYLVAQGFKVYMIDWGKPSLRHAHYDLATYIQKLMPEFLAQVRQHSGEQQLSLHGWSLGGAFSLSYTALFKDKDIRNIVILGSPIDTHQSGYMGKIYQFIQRQSVHVRKHTSFRLHKLPSRLFHVPGISNTIGFKLTDPIGNLAGYWELLTKLGDRDYVITHATASAFLDNMMAYPGGVMRDLILRYWIDNELSTGVVRFGEQTANLKEVDSALLAVGGQNDNICTVDAVRPVLDLVSSRDKEFVIVPGGHMGIVSGSKAPESVWIKTAEWLAARSN